jgi:hypothetical protein
MFFPDHGRQGANDSDRGETFLVNGKEVIVAFEGTFQECLDLTELLGFQPDVQNKLLFRHA